MIGRGHSYFGQPCLMPAIVNLEEAIATLTAIDGPRLVFAFTVCDKQGTFFKVIGPRISNDLYNFCLRVLGDGRGGDYWC